MSGPQKASFGEILVQRKLITAEQLEYGLEVQREREKKGDFSRLGQIMVELEFITPQQVQEVLGAQKITIKACQACGSRYNAHASAGKTECPKCGGKLAPAKQIEDVTVQDTLEGQELELGDKIPELNVIPSTAVFSRMNLSVSGKIRMLRRLGEYVILGEIGRGGMGIIYKARQRGLGRLVALKTLRQEELERTDSVKRFRDEARAVANLRHPNIVGIYEVGTHKGIEYFTMDFIEGLALDRQILMGGLSARRAVEIVLPVAEALEYAHRKQVLHRDIKPSNIILDRDGIPFLVDFGIAMNTGPEEEEEELVGCPYYIAPEYIEGHPFDARCDVYALGVVLYETLSGGGNLPFFDQDTRRLMQKVVEGRPKPITCWVPDVDPELRRIVERMLAPRERRYKTMGDAVEDLRRWSIQDAAEPVAAPAQPGAPAPVAAPVHALTVAPAAPPSRPVLPIVVALAASLGLMWAGHSLTTTREELAVQRTEVARLTREKADELCRLRLRHARQLLQLNKTEPALAECDQVIREHGAKKLEVLAEVYWLRGKLRQALRKEGAEADLREAARRGYRSPPPKN